jgi:hypothetical protein
MQKNEHKIFDYIEKLRARPEHERQVIAITAAAVITGIITALWLVSKYFGV